MNSTPPHVLLARLAHELETVRLYLKDGDVEGASFYLGAAQAVATQLQEAVK